MRRTVAAGFTALLLLSCNQGTGDGTVDVFAAASLEAAFREIATELERTEGVVVRLNLGASSDLVRSIVDGSPAQVFASADPENMAAAVDAGVVEDPQTFATNELAIAVGPGNPLNIRSLADLPEASIAVCAPEVPCGRYAQEALDAAGVELEPDSYEPDVKAVLNRVTLGEVDAGIVYVTDVLETDVQNVPIPPEHNVIALYEIAPVDADDDATRAFIDLVMSEEGRAILESHGFGLP